jgi:hypothetical protein
VLRRHRIGPATPSSNRWALRGLPFRSSLGFPLLRERAVEDLYIRFNLSLAIRQYFSNLFLLASGQRVEVDEF